MNDKPQPGKIYNLTGTGNSIANGNSWEESLVSRAKLEEETKLQGKDNNEEIKELMAKIVKLSAFRFVEGHKATDEQCIGMAISNYFEWDSRIIEVCKEALTDANFHTESAKLA